MRPGDPGRCTAWETGFGVVEIGEPAADDGDAPVFGDRKDTMREALRWRGKALAVFHGHGIFLHFAASPPDRAWAIVDHYVPGLNCRHWFHVVELRADGTHVLSPPFGECGLDGVEVASATHMTLSPRQVGDQVAFLGRNWGHPSFNGRLQDFRVYSGALSAAEIAALMK